MSKNLSELVEKYRDIREELDIRRKEFNKFEDESKQMLMDLEVELLEILQGMGAESLRTKAGTVFQTVKTYARLGSGEESKQRRIDWSIKNNDFGLFTSHVNKTHAKELLDDGVNLAEVGIDWVEELTVQVRKPSN